MKITLHTSGVGDLKPLGEIQMPIGLKGLFTEGGLRISAEFSFQAF